MSRPRSAAVIAVTCGTALVPTAMGQVLFDNGGLVTTPSPACIPVTSSASQLQTVGGIANGLFGVGCQLEGPTANHVADDFVVSNPAGWTIASVQLSLYETNWLTTTSSTITAVYLRVWNGQPGTPGAAVVWGDSTTNRLTSAVFSNTYRVGASCSLNRVVFTCTAQVGTVLGPGTYWLDMQAAGSEISGPWMPVVTLTGVRGKPGANAVQFVSADGVWTPVVDEGLAVPPSPAVAQDVPFTLLGTVGSCYANCDGSSLNPVLTANDFQCFLNKFAASDPYANCDGSSLNPVLTANDFQCFLNKFAGGCT